MSSLRHSSSPSHKYIPRRAVLYVPGNDEKKIKKIPSLNVDCAVLDCEDGVAVNKKVMAWFFLLMGNRVNWNLVVSQCIAHCLERLCCMHLLLVTNVFLTSPYVGSECVCLFTPKDRKNSTKIYLKSWPAVCVTTCCVDKEVHTQSILAMMFAGLGKWCNPRLVV